MSQHLPCSAQVIGKALADVAMNYEAKHKTGYFPVIEFFKTLENVDPDLIRSAEQVSWVVAKLAREKIQKRLRPIFSSVQFSSIQTQAFSMPRVRPHQADAHERLAIHYSPDTVKTDLLLTMMRRDNESEDNRAEPYARKMIFRWLESEFESVELTGSKALS